MEAARSSEAIKEKKYLKTYESTVGESLVSCLLGCSQWWKARPPYQHPPKPLEAAERLQVQAGLKAY